MNPHLPLRPGWSGFVPPLFADGWSPALLIGLGFVVLALLVVGSARLRHVLTRKRVAARFDAFREHVIALRERVEALQQRHELLPASNKEYVQQMAGTTLKVYTRLKEEFGRLMDDWRRRMELWERVQMLIAAEKPFSAGRLKEAERLLDQLGSFDEVDMACSACAEQLDRLDRGHEEARQLLGRAEERTPGVREKIAAVAALGYPTDSYEATLQGCAELAEQARGMLTADPLGAVAAMENAHDKLTATAELADDVVRQHERAGKARAELDRVARSVASRRGGGLLLTEPDGNPDPLLARGSEHHAEALEALRRAQPQKAASDLDRAFALAQEADDVMERQEKARARCEHDIPARRTEAQRLRQALAEAEDQHRELEQAFAPKSWTAVADNTSRAANLLSAAEGHLDEAAQASEPTVQHYFRAIGLLDRVERSQQEAGRLLTAVGQCLRELKQLRDACGVRQREVADLARRVDGFLTASHRSVRAPARGRFDAAEAARRQASEQARALRPHWPAVRQQLDEAARAYAEALQQAEEDVRQHQQLEARLAEVSREAERVGGFLQQHPAHRAKARGSHRAALEALQRIGRDCDRPADWGQLLRAVDEAARELHEAEKLARQDVELARRAEREIAEAERALGWASGQAGDLLEQARRHFAAQAYERAVEAAQGARRTHEEAVRQEQRRQEEERRRQAAASAATASPAAAAPDWSGPSAASGPEAPPPGPSATSGEPDQTSW